MYTVARFSQGSQLPGAKQFLSVTNGLCEVVILGKSGLLKRADWSERDNRCRVVYYS